MRSYAFLVLALLFSLPMTLAAQGTDKAPSTARLGQKVPNLTFQDAAGNAYSIDAAGNAMENGSPIAGGSGTAEMAYYNGAVYGEDSSTSSPSASTWSGSMSKIPMGVSVPQVLC